MTSDREGYFSLNLFCLGLGPLKGFFELTRRPSRALNWPRALLPEIKVTVKCAAIGAEVQGHHCQKQMMQTLIPRVLKTRIFKPILNCKKSTEEN